LVGWLVNPRKLYVVCSRESKWAVKKKGGACRISLISFFTVETIIFFEFFWNKSHPEDFVYTADTPRVSLLEKPKQNSFTMFIFFLNCFPEA